MNKDRGSPPGILDFPCDVERLPNGNTLISDAGAEDGSGSEIIEVDPGGNVIWNYHDGLRFAHSAKRMPNGNTSISDTTNNRVLEVSPAGEEVFTSDSWAGGTGTLSDGSHLHYPNDAHPLPDGRILITDRNNDRCVIVDRQGTVLRTVNAGVKHPHNGDLLPNGNLLIADSDGNSVKEVDPAGNVVWAYADPANPLAWPRDADRLPNGNTQIVDSKNRRVLEVTPAGKVAWTYAVPYFANFYDADRLPNGNVLISDQQHHQVLEVNPAREVVWRFRNYRPIAPANERLLNTSFKIRGANGAPEHWMLGTRLSEGGGKLVWTPNPKGQDVPGLEYDRPGALCLQQKIAAEPGSLYTVSAKIRTENVRNMTCVQVAFLDEHDGLIQDVLAAPKGRLFSGTADWTLDSFEAEAPPGAVAAEVRLFINGPGRVWVNNINCFC
ncbi:MAG: hypothetical protein JXR37_08485 [Kiritimatiellae bacterium]|nr:hypothetical protein [Kiritimatiellia bacterium]